MPLHLSLKTSRRSKPWRRLVRTRLAAARARCATQTGHACACQQSSFPTWCVMPAIRRFSHALTCPIGYFVTG